MAAIHDIFVEIEDKYENIASEMSPSLFAQ